MKKSELDVSQLEKEADLYENPLTEKQRDILTAAEKLFARNGFLETPTAEIAREANVTEKTLFKHFPSKDDLLRRVLVPLILKTLLPAQLRKIKDVFNNGDRSFGDMFLAFTRERITEVNRNKGKVKFVLMEMLRRDTFRKQIHNIWVTNIWNDAVAGVERLQKQGKIRSDIKASTIVRVQISLAAGCALKSALFVEGDKKADNEELQEILEVLLHGVTKK